MICALLGLIFLPSAAGIGPSGVLGLMSSVSWSMLFFSYVAPRFTASRLPYISILLIAAAGLKWNVFSAFSFSN